MTAASVKMAQVKAQRTRAEELSRDLARKATELGASAADATCGFGSHLSAKARDGEVEDITRSSSNGAGIRVIVDGKLGFATSAAAPRDASEVEGLCRDAIALARIATTSEHNIIPSPTAPTEVELAKIVADLRLFDDKTAGLDADWALQNALIMDKIVRETDGIETVREASAAAGVSVFALASSTGFVGSYAGSSCHYYAGAVAKDGDKNQVDGWWTASRRVSDLDRAEDVAIKAADRALKKCNAVKLTTRDAPVIFDPDMARGFIGAMLSAIDGERLAQKASFLNDKLGEPIFAPGYAVHDKPFLKDGQGSRPFDGEGQRVSPCEIIDDKGVLKQVLLDARSASELGLPLSGHAGRGATGQPGPSISNIVLDGGKGSLDSIIAESDGAFLVTSLMGHSPDMITGEYSRGASGFWIEGGEIKHAVEEVTIAGDMAKMMMSIDRVGADADIRSSIRAPSLRFAKLTISGS